MVLSSGLAPYSYDYGGGPFRTPNSTCDGLVLGPSGKLLEQAQFVITAEYRRWRGGVDHAQLEDFNIYVHPDIAPSGPYEPKSNGSTIANEIRPANLIFIDHIIETREALEAVLGRMAGDSDFSQDGLLQSWLSALYPNNPSGINGDYSHREPSATGLIMDLNADVLGSSGVLYDVDFGEVMYNPYPVMGRTLRGNFHGDRTNGGRSTFLVRMSPAFPSFQKTNGAFASLNGREPAADEISNVNIVYNIDHVSLNQVRLDGYALTSDSKYYLGTGSDILDGVEDFSFAAAGTRTPISTAEVDMEQARVFLTRTTETSGVKRIAAKNSYIDFPQTTIESGVASIWPNSTKYWPTQGALNSATSSFNVGYEVFDDCFWLTDQDFGVGSVSNYASGLAIVSPFTGHTMWVRFAELVNESKGYKVGETPPTSNWGWQLGMERIDGSTIIRCGWDIRNPVIAADIPGSNPTTFADTSGTVAFIEYNNNLDFVSETISTSEFISNVFQHSSVARIGDMFWDGTHYWLLGFNNGAGNSHTAWKFDSLYNFSQAYVFDPEDGSSYPTFSLFLNRAKGAFIDSRYFFYNYELNELTGQTSGPQLGKSSGITEFFFTDGADPNANPPTFITTDTPKDINGAPHFGYMEQAEIIDMIEVTGGTHTRDGIYVLIRFKRDISTVDDGPIHILRIEEGFTTWEIKAIYTISDTSFNYPLDNTNAGGSTCIMHMDIN